MSLIPLMAMGFGWPLVPALVAFPIPYALAAIRFVSVRASREDVLLLGAFLSVPIAYLGHEAMGTHGFGPRFYYDVFPCLYVLMARGVSALATPGSDIRENPAARRLATCLAAFLLVGTALTIPFRLRLYRGYNDSSAAYVRLLEGAPGRALFLLDRDMDAEWVKVGVLLPSRLGSAERVFAKRREDSTKILEAYRDRPAFLLSEGRLVPIAPGADGRTLGPPAGAGSTVPPP
jgi:hypothetical protein